MPDPAGTTEFVYDPQGHLVHTESPNGGTGWRGEVFAGNRHLASYANGNLIFAHSDWLGTERNRDLPDPNNPQYPSNQNITSLPFGDWLDNTQAIPNNDWTPLNFTGQYHDFETDLDYFGARYYSSTTGRFTSADAFSGKLLVNPQDLNLYTYAINNPLRYFDPNGRDWKDVVRGIGQGANSFVEHTYAAVTAAAKDPFTLIHGAASAIETAGKAYGTAEGRSGLSAQWNSLSQQDKAAVVTEALIAGGIGGTLKGQASGTASTTADTTTVTHFTSDAGVNAITDAGGTLRSGTYVTTPGDIPAGSTSSAVEQLLEIGPGKGANSITFDTPNSNLTVPGNGPTTSGGATQFQLRDPTPIDPTKFKPTPKP